MLTPVDDADEADLPDVRGPGRPRGPGPVQRLGRAAGLRSAVARPHPALAARGRLRRAAPARADRPERVDAGAVRRQRPDRRDVPHRHRPQPCAAGLRHGAAAGAGEDHRPHRGLTGRPPRRRGAPRRRRGAHPQRRRRRPLRGSASRSHGRPPDRPSCSSAASTSRARAWRCCSRRCPSWSHRVPDVRLLVAGPGDAERGARGGAAVAARPRRAARPGQRRATSRGCSPAATSTARRTPTARASASCWSRRWRPARRSSPATSRRSAGCSTTAQAGVLVPVARRRCAGRRAGALLLDPDRRGPRWLPRRERGAGLRLVGRRAAGRRGLRDRRAAGPHAGRRRRDARGRALREHVDDGGLRRCSRRCSDDAGRLVTTLRRWMAERPRRGGA